MRNILITGAFALALTLASGIHYFLGKYHIADHMLISVEEVTTADYPEDPSHRSSHYDRYSHRTLTLNKHDGHLFDFIFTSKHPEVAAITFKNIDLSLFVPRAPEWIKNDENLKIIAFSDREWNRQQVRFEAKDPHLEVIGGDGFEKENLYSAELARNCLNAGLWEVLLFTQEDGKKSLYYQGWFTFPLGHYRNLFKELNGLSYWDHWFRLEHCFDSHGKVVKLDRLRIVENEYSAQVDFDADETVFLGGEQMRKAHALDGKNVRCWRDMCTHSEHVRFASFIPPGRYSVEHPWANEFERISKVLHATVRTIRTPASKARLHEVEITFLSADGTERNRLFISGIDLDALAQHRTSNYAKGLYMPMGIGVPPFYQTYTALAKLPPHETPYFSFILGENDEWINHHDAAIDGPVLHRDIKDPNKVHVYLLSYERHSLLGHYIIHLR